jgi:AcrR family transcriptional regulator
MPDQLRDQLIDAALACVARVGVAKTTLDDVAREAKCARATVYRYFPGKQSLLLAAVEREADRVGGELVAAAAGTETLVDAATAVVVHGARALLECAPLTYVLTVEPETLLPHISFERGDALLMEIARRVAPAFARFVADADRVAEWVVRIALSYLCSPEAVDMLDDVRVRALMEDFVLPGLIRPAEHISGVRA